MKDNIHFILAEYFLDYLFDYIIIGRCGVIMYRVGTPVSLDILLSILSHLGVSYKLYPITNK